jgi:hypothetical protein
MSLNIATFTEFAEVLRAALPDVRIACGGPAGIRAGLDVLRNSPATDIVAIGEGGSSSWFNACISRSRADRGGRA